MIVFVHGVPETAAIWRKIQGIIDRPSTAVSLPGFGCALPDGFTPSKDAYVEWLVAELDAIGEPIDLVGHDWGAGLTYRLPRRSVTDSTRGSPTSATSPTPTTSGTLRQDLADARRG